MNPNEKGHQTNSIFKIENALHGISIIDFANRLKQIQHSMGIYDAMHANILFNYIDENFFECDELYPYVEYRGYSYSDGVLSSVGGDVDNISFEEQIKRARLEGTLRRPINLDAVDTFPFSLCNSKWVYMSYTSHDHENTSGYDKSLFNTFLTSIINHASMGLVFSYSYTTYIGPSRYDHHSDTYIEYLLCFEKETNLEVVIQSLSRDFLALSEAHLMTCVPSIKILKTSEEIASFFKGDYLFEVYSGLYCFDFCIPRLFVFQVSYSILEYYLFFRAFVFNSRTLSMTSYKVLLNEYILFDCSQYGYPYQMPSKEDFECELSSGVDPILYKHIYGLSDMLFRCYVFIPQEYQKRHVVDENYSILKYNNTVSSFIQIYLKKSDDK